MNEIDEPIENNMEIDTFIQDIQCILQDINENQNKKRTEIKEHFKNIASNPKHSYSAKEQVAVLFEIMKCYNINIVEYQKNMRELGIITKTLIKAHNDKAFSNESHTSDETIVTGSSLYEYFIQLIWGKPIRKTAVEPGKEPSVDLANIFIDKENDVIEHNFADVTNRKAPESNSDIVKKTVRRRNTIQPIVKHIPNM